MSLAVASQSLAHVLQHGLKAKIGCSEPCTLDAKLLANRSLRRRLKLPAKNALAHNTTQLTAAGSRLVTLKLTTRERHALHALRKATLTLSVRATDTADNDRIRTIAVHLRN
jgi:hypothetical protein